MADVTQRGISPGQQRRVSRINMLGSRRVAQGCRELVCVRTVLGVERRVSRLRFCVVEELLQIIVVSGVIGGRAGLAAFVVGRVGAACAGSTDGSVPVSSRAAAGRTCSLALDVCGLGGNRRAEILAVGWTVAARTQKIEGRISSQGKPCHASRITCDLVV